jgi:Protein of unknown function (DUF1344)
MKRVLTLVVAVAVSALVLAPLAWAGDVQGTVKSVDQTGQVLTLDDGTQLLLPPGLGVKRNDLQPGDNVKASYEENSGQKVVTSLEVRPAAK